VGGWGRRRFLCGVGGPVVLAVALSSCGSTGPTGGAEPAGGPVSTFSMVAPTPVGFTSEAIDGDSGGKTGTIGVAEASSADCNGVPAVGPGPGPGAWVASELRYFDDSREFPMTALVLCVTQLASSSAAGRDREDLMSVLAHRAAAFSAPVSFAVSGVPGALGYDVAGNQGLVDIFFARGRYFVFVSAAGVSPSGGRAARKLATELAGVQYARLSG
jgi:hypothetical protein